MPISKPFSVLSKNDVGAAGGKGASLGELTQAGIPVPPGFVVLSETFDRFLQETDLVQEVDAILHTVDHQKIHTVEDASARIQALIKSAKMPEDIAADIQKHFSALGAEYVAVRSSATAEDSAAAAWAGQLDSFLNTTQATLLQNVQNCWASLFTPRAIFYRFEQGMHSQHISVAVVVQVMVASDVSGIAFSVHPVTEDPNQLIIEAGFGLGEAIVSGQITPDSYVVEKEPRHILDVNVSHQTRALFRAPGGGNEWRDLTPEVGNSQVLPESKIQELSNLILRIEQHYGFPCDIEWAMEGDTIFIVQSRPITTLKQQNIGAPKIELTKSYSRDTTLFMQVLWVRTVTEQLRVTLKWDNPFSPMLVHYMNDGVVEIWENAEALRWFYDKLLSTSKETAFVSHLVQTYKAPLVELQAFRATKDFSDAADVTAYITLIKQAIFPFTLLFYIGMDERSSDEAKTLVVASRKETDFFAENDVFVRKCIAKRAEISEELAGVILPNELDAVPSEEVLRQRLRSFVMVDGANPSIGTLEAYQRAHPTFHFKVTGITSPNDISGQSAYNGIVRGAVRIVKKQADMAKVHKGDVLVAPMTTPDFLPAMHKAAAFVTDEGGVTCHAAIVSRELKIPCIIGTKIATQALHDGDEVEVDADNGVVRILNRKTDSGGKTSDDIVTTLQQTQLQKEWEGPISLFHCSFASQGYFKDMQDVFGISFPFIYLTFENGIASGFLPMDAYRVVGERIAERAQDPQRLGDWCDAFKKSADTLRQAIDASPETFLTRVAEFKQAYNAYTAYQVAAKTAANFLPMEGGERILESLEAARKYSETLFNVSEQKIQEVLHWLHERHPEYTTQQLSALAVDDLQAHEREGTPLPTPEELEARFRHSGTYWSEAGIQFLTGAEAEAVRQHHLANAGKELKGTAAYPGNVRGRCRVIRDYQQADIAAGDILVTGMTDPRFVPLMKKAAAIVTDGGGILCHAAIVSRELKTPCIIGTMVATQVLKDGDEVEVDANSGTVKILKRA